MIKDVEHFMRTARKLPKRGEPDSELAGLYIGLCLEELAELMDSQSCPIYARELTVMANEWKDGNLVFGHSSEALDAFIDLSWVSLGGAFAMGADVEGAANAVANNNMSKFPKCTNCNGSGQVYTELPRDSMCSSDTEQCKTCNGTGRVVLLDENGKIKKPEGFSPVDLKKYL